MQPTAVSFKALTATEVLSGTQYLLLTHSPPNEMSYLVIITHQGPATVLWSQKPIHEHCPSKRKMEFNILLKVGTKLVTVQVIAECEALPGDQHVYLTTQRDWEKRL